ncbi:MAG: GntR family transcriptional regulator [Bacillota bacterium]|nr:GntR family transcriptional regulator [Eubacteriales bacterium]MDD4285985.1 GntR family transcriptional regulator [Eubacteriales bacterium]MDI9492844.1 GntR family transcriptional regulator [Bacillota bacterium]NLV70576.1 GntR family transcriptional regulator [Clostridiales bacterium]
MRKSLLTLNIVLAKELHYMLRTQRYLPGDKLPSERILAETFGVQRATIREALNELIQEGVIVSEERKGYFMARPRIVKSVNFFAETPTIEDPHVKYKIQEASSVLADERLSGKMLIPRNTPLHRIVRLCLEEKTVIAVETYYLLKEVLPDLKTSDLKSQNIAEFIVSATNHGIAGNNQKITLVYANDNESKLLRLPAGSPLMKHKGMVYDHKGQLLVFFENILRIERFVFLRKEAL